MLRINNLVKHYGSFKALDNINLDINDKSIFGFVGPNGAGKTTILKILSGLLTHDSGNIEINGKNILENKLFLKEKIGYMPDFFGVYDDLKVYEYMKFYADAYYIYKNEQKVLIDNLLELVNLQNKKGVYVDELSRGMKQRLCLARSLIHNPEILILDEPASGLDPKARFEMKEILKSLKESDKTIIISSHILPELSEMCTDIGVIDNGKICISGKIEDIIKKTSSHKAVIIKPYGKVNELKSFIETNDLISDVKIIEDEIIFNYSGEDKQMSYLITSIINEGYSILSVMEKKEVLEDVFMKIIGGDKV